MSSGGKRRRALDQRHNVERRLPVRRELREARGPAARGHETEDPHPPSLARSLRAMKASVRATESAVQPPMWGVRIALSQCARRRPQAGRRRARPRPPARRAMCSRAPRRARAGRAARDRAGRRSPVRAPRGRSGSPRGAAARRSRRRRRRRLRRARPRSRCRCGRKQAVTSSACPRTAAQAARVSRAPVLSGGVSASRSWIMRARRRRTASRRAWRQRVAARLVAVRFLFTTLQFMESDFYRRVSAELATRGHEVAHVAFSRRAAESMRRPRAAGLVPGRRAAGERCVRRRARSRADRRDQRHADAAGHLPHRLAVRGPLRCWPASSAPCATSSRSSDLRRVAPRRGGARGRHGDDAHGRA